MFEVMELRNLPWLAGRGYNTWGIYIANTVCTRTKQPYTGSYMAVLFESFTDPITTGREELGFSKLWAEMPDGTIDGTTRVHTANWFGAEFMRLELPNLVEVDVEHAPALHPRKWTHRKHALCLSADNRLTKMTAHPSVPPTAATQHGILHHRYVPTVGQPGRHDASYTTYCPAPAGKPLVINYQTIKPEDFSKVKLDITPASWDKLPTLWNVVDGLAGIPRGEVLEVAVQTFQGASDLIANQKVE